MSATRWTSLALLTFGYCVAINYGHFSLPAVVTVALLIMAGICVTQFQQRAVIGLGHCLFIVLAMALASHQLPGFFSERVIAAQRLTPEAAPFSMYLRLDKPLIGFWILLVCPWLLTNINNYRSVSATALIGLGTAFICINAAMALGLVGWAPKWPEYGTLWLVNNLLLVTLTEELLFRTYIQGGLQQLFKPLRYGRTLALCCAAVLFGLAHLGTGWQWALLAGVAGAGYGLAYRYSGLPGAVITHFGVNLLHFSLFTYPMFDR
jgi:membrane protease YdiL (CAAX protease family)